MVFPVRYVAGKRIVDTFARELSELGMSISCNQPPQPGTIIGIQLFLPNSTTPCAATGVVVEQRGESDVASEERNEYGGCSFWADFTGITRRSDAIIAALLQAGQRASRRPAVSFKVSCRIGDRLVYELAENVSVGGVFVRFKAPPVVETIVEAQLELPDGKPPAKVWGRVAHASPRGFGLQFFDGDEGFRVRVEALVLKLCR